MGHENKTDQSVYTDLKTIRFPANKNRMGQSALRIKNWYFHKAFVLEFTSIVWNSGFLKDRMTVDISYMNLG